MCYTVQPVKIGDLGLPGAISPGLKGAYCTFSFTSVDILVVLKQKCKYFRKSNIKINKTIIVFYYFYISNDKLASIFNYYDINKMCIELLIVCVYAYYSYKHTNCVYLKT